MSLKTAPLGLLHLGVGNLTSVANVLKKMDIAYELVQRPEDLVKVNKVLFPGVGSFDHAVQGLKKFELWDPLKELLSSRRISFLGICLGAQMLLDSSDEGLERGMGIIPGKVRKLNTGSTSLKIPHVGWNQVVPTSAYQGHSLFQNLPLSPRGLEFYFVHSYIMHPHHPEHLVAQTEYGENFCSILGRDNIWGVQFHPEKGHALGQKFLKNFALGASC